MKAERHRPLPIFAGIAFAGVITVAGGADARMHHHVTFRPSATGMAEERLIRGLHPYIAQRMQMERLRKFDLTRLPSSDDEEVYLFRCVARENASDRRLVAFAQVRDLTALRDQDGRLLTLPTAEAALASCVDSIRRAQRGSTNLSSANRIIMYVWPPIDVDADVLDHGVDLLVEEFRRRRVDRAHAGGVLRGQRGDRAHALFRLPLPPLEHRSGL